MTKMERQVGQRWLWHDVRREMEDLAIAEIIKAPDRVLVIQVLKGRGISGYKLGEALWAEWNYKGESGSGGWVYLEGQDKPV